MLDSILPFCCEFHALRRSWILNVLPFSASLLCCKELSLDAVRSFVFIAVARWDIAAGPRGTLACVHGRRSDVERRRRRRRSGGDAEGGRRGSGGREKTAFEPLHLHARRAWLLRVVICRLLLRSR